MLMDRTLQYPTIRYMYADICWLIMLGFIEITYGRLYHKYHFHLYLINCYGHPLWNYVALALHYMDIEILVGHQWFVLMHSGGSMLCLITIQHGNLTHLGVFVLPRLGIYKPLSVSCNFYPQEMLWRIKLHNPRLFQIPFLGLISPP